MRAFIKSIRPYILRAFLIVGAFIRLIYYTAFLAIRTFLGNFGIIA
jgi:hypothetical protein